ncbi:MAG: DEAD/DEAH box helicase family protein, partial [archaeon]
ESKYVDYLLLDKDEKPLAIIEAKRTGKDATIGQKQAEEYAKDIQKQTGKPIFIFFTNGYEIWFWNKHFANPRMVKGFHNQTALERIHFQNENKRNFREIPINQKIINRDYQVEAVKRVLEGIERGKRKFLIVQATGTGKTRVSMALIDILLKSNAAQKILFLTDRKALRDQAFDEGFKVFFPHEVKTKVYSATVDKNSRLYASTIQTFMECYQDFSPGDFDIIISDEAHRSIYNKWKDVFTYFDAIQVGLTATPSDLIEKDSFRFFECDDGAPTYLYSYEQAVKDDWLCKFTPYSASTHFQIAGIKPKDVPSAIREELEGKGISEEELDFEGTDIEKKVIVKGTNEALVKEIMDVCLLDETGKPAKTIIFAVSKKHAKRIWEAFEKLYPEYKGELAKIIVSEDSRAQELIKEFKEEDFPRIAISVDMLDTGIDVPEVCNLVFAKPVFSKIKFWQMLGRGTRHDKVCKHKNWLPNGKKNDFLAIDFWNVFDYFGMHPEGKEVYQSEAVTGRIFKVRLEKFLFLNSKKDTKNADQTKQSLIDDIKKLPMESIAVREHARDVEMALSSKFWDNVGLDPAVFLKTKINPLMRFQNNVNLDVAYFTLKTEQLGFAILKKNEDEIERLKESIGEYLNCLPRTVKAVKAKEELIDKVLSKKFWENITYEDSLIIQAELAPLMKYKRPEPRPVITLDIDDIVEQRKIIEFGPAPTQEYVGKYREKVEKAIKELAAQHPTIKKIKADKPLTEEDLHKLEKALNSPDLYITEEVLQKVYGQNKGTLVQFLKKILGMYEFPEPATIIDEEFRTFIIEHAKELNSNQINFLRTLRTVFTSKKHIELADFYEPPFTNIPNAPTPLFKEPLLKEIVLLCKTLEEKVSA